MAVASIEFGPLALGGLGGSGTAIHGVCRRQEELAVAAGVTNTTTIAAVAADDVARVAVDTQCYVAVGSAPDPTATTATAATSARRLALAGVPLDVPLKVGDLVAVRG